MITIREVSGDDEARVREISTLALARLREVYRPTAEAIQRKAARKHLRRGLVATLEGTVVGTLEYEHHGEQIRLLGPMVHPDFRRRGVARQLIEHVGGIARSIGVPILALSTIEQTGNVPIFQRLGFRIVRRVEPQGLESVVGERLVEVEMER